MDKIRSVQWGRRRRRRRPGWRPEINKVTATTEICLFFSRQQPGARGRSVGSRSHDAAATGCHRVQRRRGGVSSPLKNTGIGARASICFGFSWRFSPTIRGNKTNVPAHVRAPPTPPSAVRLLIRLGISLRALERPAVADKPSATLQPQTGSPRWKVVSSPRSSPQGRPRSAARREQPF